MSPRSSNKPSPRQAGSTRSGLRQPGYERIAFVASPFAEAKEAEKRLRKLYGNVKPESADVIVALGGDGLMLQTLRRFMRSGKPIYGMHRGTVGFLMNEFRARSCASGSPRRRRPSSIRC